MEPLFKSIFGWLDYQIDQDPIRQDVSLNENQTISFLGSLSPQYNEGRILFKDGFYHYRGVKLIINEDYRYLAG